MLIVTNLKATMIPIAWIWLLLWEIESENGNDSGQQVQYHKNASLEQDQALD